jgi:hypothetical protein
MIAHIIAGAKRALGLHRVGRSLLIFPDDTFLVSFPKSGNTWARFQIGNLLSPNKPVTFENIHAVVPDPEATPKRDLDRVPRPRVIKSHECFEPRYPRIIYLVRDPRDVVVSQYHYHRKCRKIEDGYPMDKFVARFLAGQTCPHGSWGENVGSWLMARRSDPRFLLVRYEDMISEGPRELGRISSFLGLASTQDAVSRAAERSSADRMRKMEKAQADLCTLTKDSRQDLPFVRAAGSGGWSKNLSEQNVADIETAWAPLMRYLGYPLTTQGGADSSIAEFLEPILNGSPR